jgi:predicted amidohydrolase YtcJ
MTANQFVITSSTVFTGLPACPWVEAVGIKDGLIAAVGSNQAVTSALPDAGIIDMPGRMVTPGLVDAHCHFVSYSRSRLLVNLKDLTSITACREKIEAVVEKTEPGRWIVGFGWNHNLWENKRTPTKQDLDDISPHNPIMMARTCGHSEWLNSRALEAAGITPASMDPPGIRFDRNPDGSLTGLLHEAREMVQKSIPPFERDQLMACIHAGQSEILKLGLTGLHSCESLEEWDMLKDMDSAGKLKLRIHHLFQYYDFETLDNRGLKWLNGSDRLWLGHLKLFADGSLGSATALMHAPYEDDPENCGIHCLDADELKDNVLKAYKRGFSVAIHAIGDKAGTRALDAIENGRKHCPGPWRDRVEHIQLYTPDDFNRYRDLGVVASVQPGFVRFDWPVAEKKWGPERCSRAYAWKKMMNNGIRLQFGSDAPVEPIAPILGLQAAVLRQSPDFKPEGGWYPDQCLSIEESLTGFFQTAAWMSGKEDRLGSLEPGKLADLTVFENDLKGLHPREWHDVDVEMTIIGGEVVFSKS